MQILRHLWSFFIANALCAKCKLCYKSRVYPHQLGNSPQWCSGQYFSNNMLKTCVCLWVKITPTGWVHNSSCHCGFATPGVKQHKVLPLVLTKVLNSFGWKKFEGLMDKAITDSVPTTYEWWIVGQQTDNRKLRLCKGYQLIGTKAISRQIMFCRKGRSTLRNDFYIEMN